MAVDGPFADVTSLSDDVTIDGESVYSQPSVLSSHSTHSGTTYSAHYSTNSGSYKSSHSHSASYCGSLKSSANYSAIKAKRTPPLVAPRPHHSSLKRLDRLPPPYARPSSAGQDDCPEPSICKSRSTNLNGEVFTSKLTLIPDASKGYGSIGRSGFYQKPFSPKETWSPKKETWSKEAWSPKKESWSPKRHNAPFSLAPTSLDEHVYEDPEVCSGPAKLPPESGMLSKTQSKVVLRPLAFKPVMQHPPKPPRSDPTSIGDEGYYSTEYRRDYSDPYRARLESDASRHESRPGSFNSSGHSRMSSGHTDTYIQTPSPSDSGVSELEAILREKDAEIMHLRETMDGNERAIFQVFEEKKRCWQQQMDKMIQDYEEKIRIEKQKAFKSEQSLLMQMAKLQQDKKSLNSDLESARGKVQELEMKCSGLEKDFSQVKAREDESNWALHQKTGELTMVKTQLRDSKDESQQRCMELSNLRSKLNRCETELDDANFQLNKLKETFDEGKRQLQRSCQELDRLGLDKNQSFELCPGDRIANCDSADDDTNSAFQNQELKRLKNELEKLKTEKREMQTEFDEEKSQWLDEKNKVICYQKQLQLNYVQMLRKNKTLEAEVEQLMLDLERNDLKVPDSTC